MKANCRYVLLLLAAIGLSAHLIAAETVIVTGNDGKKVIGELVQSDPDKIVVRNPDGNDTEVKWTDIKKISNGLTQETAAKRWREENAEKLCPTCHGEKTIACPKCNGTGKDPRTKVTCKVCGGTGDAKCTAKGCVNGMADCPNTCLKLSEGKWEADANGLRWRKFFFGNEYKSWSEHHLGQVIEIKNGVPENVGKCPVCKGTMKVQCALCNGTGKIVCPECKGTKEVAGPCDACKGGRITCTTCKGTGLKP